MINKILLYLLGGKKDRESPSFFFLKFRRSDDGSSREFIFNFWLSKTVVQVNVFSLSLFVNFLTNTKP